MNSLEIINREIESLQTEIEHLKNAIRLKPVYADTVYECERGKECLARLNVLEQIKFELEEYKKLKVKATPKKPIRFKNSVYISNPKCPICKTIPHTGNQKYCDECGQALDWSDEEMEVEDE